MGIIQLRRAVLGLVTAQSFYTIFQKTKSEEVQLNSNIKP